MGFVKSYLIKQCSNPNGIVGSIFLRIWKNTYKSLYYFGLEGISCEGQGEILDIGCGSGESTKIIASAYPKFYTTGLDISLLAIQQAKKINKKPSNLAFHLGDSQSLDKSEESIDLITAFQTHFHWQNLDLELKEISKLLKPTGKLVIACDERMNKYHLPQFYEDSQFEKYLKNNGFVQINTERKQGYIKYVCIK